MSRSTEQRLSQFIVTAWNGPSAEVTTFDTREAWSRVTAECMRQMRWLAARAADYQHAKDHGDTAAQAGKLSLAPEGWEAPEDWFPLP